MDVGGLVARVRELAEGSGGLVRALPGVAVEGARASATGEPLAFLRDVGGWSTPSHLASFEFAHPDNFGPVLNEVWPLGDEADHWILDTSTASSTWYVHVDGGVWGRVFRFGEDPVPAVVAPDFLTWVDNLVSGVGHAVSVAREAGDPEKAFVRAFIEWSHHDPGSLVRLPETAVTPVPVARALGSPDPVVAAVAGQLPAEGFVADLRAVGYPTEVDFPAVFPTGEYIRYHHLRGGDFLGATVIPYD